MRIINPIGKALVSTKHDKGVGLYKYLGKKNEKAIRRYGLHYYGVFTGEIEEMTGEQRQKRNQRLTQIYLAMIEKGKNGRSLGSWEPMDA